MSNNDYNYDSDCRSTAGITIGIIDAIITLLHLLVGRDLTNEFVKEALADLRSHEMINKLFHD